MVPCIMSMLGAALLIFKLKIFFFFQKLNQAQRKPGVHRNIKYILDAINKENQIKLIARTVFNGQLKADSECDNLLLIKQTQPVVRMPD